MGSCGYAIFKSFGALRFGPSLLNEVRQTGSVPQTTGTSLHAIECDPWGSEPENWELRSTNAMTPSELLINAEETTIKVIFSYLSRLNFNFEEIVHEDLPLRYTRSRVVAAQLVAGWGVALLQAIPKTPAVVRQLPLHELETMKIRTKKQWKIIHHRTCYANAFVIGLKVYFEDERTNNMSSLLIRTLPNNNFTQKIIEWPGSLPQCLSNAAPTVTSTKHWFCCRTPIFACIKVCIQTRLHMHIYIYI